MSQDMLGKAIGITFQQVQKYERGTNRVSASMLHDIADVLSVPIPYFFEGYSHNGKNHGFADERAEFKPDIGSKETAALIKCYSSIKDEKVRKKVLSLVKSIAASESEV